MWSVALGCGRESVTTRKPKVIQEIRTGNETTTTNVSQRPAEKLTTVSDMDGRCWNTSWNYLKQVESTVYCKLIKIKWTYVAFARWRSWLRHCATNRRVAGSNSRWCHGIFHWRNPSGCTMALGLIQPLTEMSTRNISWGVKAADVEGWQPYDFHVPNVLKYGNLNLLEPSGPVHGCNGSALPLPMLERFWKHPVVSSWSCPYN
jgi:hypothetical protein